MKKFFSIFVVSFTLVFSTSLFANKIGVIYDSGGKFDKSFNELAYNSAMRVVDELGFGLIEFEAANNTQIEQGMRKVADRGATLIVAMGFAQADAVAAVAPDYPDINFVNVDVCWLDDPAGNIYQACYKEHEGSFLVGMIAAMASKTGKVGFVGGMDIPLIRKFQGGYEQGALYANPDIEIFANMTGTTPEAWNNPTKGAELTKAQIDKGADVVYQAAGGTGIGVLQAAADAGIMGIGVDTNQNWMHPGNMLTSMLKRLDLTIFEQAEKTSAGTFQPAIVVLGLAEGMVGYATEDGQVTAEMQSAVAAASADIVSGSIVVADWSQE
jgi:basic membrane protein A